MNWLKRCWNGLWGSSKETGKHDRILEKLAIIRSPRWYVREEYEERYGGMAGMTTIVLYRERAKESMVMGMKEITEWSAENTVGRIVYEIVDQYEETENGAIRYYPQGSNTMVTKLRRIKMGEHHRFSFSDENDAFAFKMRWG